MKIASWNVNSLRVRLAQMLEWLAATKVDVLGVQETKTQDNDFPVDALNAAGYEVLFSGQKTYNGVALLARTGTVVEQHGSLHSAETDLPGLDDPQRRVLAATLGDVRVINLYVPNGSQPDSDKYAYKLDWLHRLHDYLQAQLSSYPRTVVMGDFNIAPQDIDVHDPAAWEGSVLVSPQERQALHSILGLGFCDSFRQFEQSGGHFSWWDYRGGSFRRNNGLRIDLILASEEARAELCGGWIDKEPRTWERPSDHAPVVAEFTF